jgi:hypothetical protein
VPSITCLTCKRSAHSTLSETGWESFPGGWLVRISRGIAELVCSMKCADELDRCIAGSRTVRPLSCLEGRCCTCHKTHSSMTCCAHDEPMVPR